MSEVFFESKIGRYYVGFSQEVLKKFPNNYIDIVFTDPPFFENNGIEDYRAYVEVLPELFRIMKGDSWLILYFPSNRLDVVLKDTTKYFEYVDRFIVMYLSNKSKGFFGDKRTLELLVFRKGKPKMRGRIYSDILYGLDDPLITDVKPKTPHWKPTLVASLLLSRVFWKEDRGHNTFRLLDPFAGFGSILVVAERLGIPWIGIDVDVKKAEIAKKILLENNFNILNTIRKL